MSHTFTIRITVYSRPLLFLQWTVSRGSPHVNPLFEKTLIGSSVIFGDGGGGAVIVCPDHPRVNTGCGVRPCPARRQCVLRVNRNNMALSPFGLDPVCMQPVEDRICCGWQFCWSIPCSDERSQSDVLVLNEAQPRTARQRQTLRSKKQSLVR